MTVTAFVLSVAASLIAAGIAGLSVGYWKGRRRGKEDAEIATFYKAIGPVLTTLRAIRAENRILAADTRRLVASITRSFSFAYLGGANRLPIRQVDYRAIAELQRCDICADDARIKSMTCTECGLDCSAWDLSTLPGRPEDIPASDAGISQP